MVSTIAWATASSRARRPAPRGAPGQPAVIAPASSSVPLRSKRTGMSVRRCPARPRPKRPAGTVPTQKWRSHRDPKRGLSPFRVVAEVWRTAVAGEVGAGTVSACSSACASSPPPPPLSGGSPPPPPPPALAVMIGVLLPATAARAAGEPKTETASAGAVTATLTYTDAGDGRWTGLKLQVTRAGAQVYDSGPTIDGCEQPYCAPMAPFGDQGSIHVADLDGDGEPEVLADFYSGGAHCCEITEVLRWTGAGYATTVRNFADA